MTSRLIVRIGAVLCWVSPLALVVLTFLPPTAVPSRPTGNDPLWYEVCTKFYEEAATFLRETAHRQQVSSVCLLPTANATGFICSSPCNAGLVRELDRQVRSRPGAAPLELSWWGDHVVTDFYRRGLAALLPTHLGNVLTGGRWWKGADSSLSLSPAEAEQTQNQALLGRIIISNLSIDRAAKTFQADFGLEVRRRDGGAETLGPRTYTGGTRQLRWFLRKKAPLSHVVPFLTIPLLLLLAWLWRSWRRGVLPVERVMGWICVVTGVFFLCAILYVLRFDRREAYYYKPTNIFLLVDRNSEVFFDLSEPGGRTTPTGPAVVVQKTCEAVRKSLGREIYGSQESSFRRWLFSPDFWHCLYEPPKYELNQRWNPLLYYCSGREEDAATLPGVSASRALTELSRPGASSGVIYRESRLVAPVVEVQALAARDGVPDDEPRIALLFTSACAPYEQEVSRYLRDLRELDRTKATVARTAAFTVFFPTLPRTGSEAYYHFEEGKLLLASLGADVVVHTNQTRPDLAAARQTLAPYAWAADLSARPGASEPQVWRPASYVQVPIFHLPNVGWACRDQWDTPCDLEARRTDLLRVPDADTLQRQCEEMARQFVAFAKERVSKDQEPQRVIHVLEARKNDLIFLTAVGAALGFLIFCSQYNLVFLDHYVQEPVLRSWDRVCLLVSGPAVVFLFFWSLWHWHGTARWAFRGWADLAYCSVVSLWLAMFVAPSLVFRLHCWSSQRDEDSYKTYRNVKVVVAVLVALAVALVHLSNRFVSDPRVRLLIPLGLWLVVSAVLLWEWRRSGRHGVEPFPGRLEVWRVPTVACLGKCLMLACLMQLVYGVVDADGGGWEWQVGLLGVPYLVGVGVLMMVGTLLSLERGDVHVI